MNNTLVVYFSATGHTAKVAKALSELFKADLHEILPLVPYTKADLNWLNRKSRSSLEMRDKTFRPPIVSADLEIGKYDTIFLGFPIWRLAS